MKISYIISSRRLGYLHRNDSEILSQFYKAQLADSYQGDYVQLVKGYKKLINIQIKDE